MMLDQSRNTSNNTVAMSRLLMPKGRIAEILTMAK